MGSVAGSSNGRTAVFGVVNLGSNPSPAAIRSLSDESGSRATPFALEQVSLTRTVGRLEVEQEPLAPNPSSKPGQ